MLPTAQAVLSAGDWDAKKALQERLAREKEQRDRAAQDALAAYNQACDRLNSDTLRCPHCAAQDIKFRDGRSGRKSYWQCNVCSRSFRKEDLGEGTQARG
jgi:transposase-like protein